MTPLRQCQTCGKTIPANDVGFGCKPCFLAGTLTDFCSRPCLVGHTVASCPEFGKQAAGAR